jgi:Zn-dependent protease with chaperone function
MKFSTIFLTALLISSHLTISTSNHGIYYNELKVFKRSSKTRALFEQDVEGSSCTTQHNLGIYTPTLLDSGERGLFSRWDTMIRTLSLGNIKRQITISKELSFIDSLLITKLCDPNDDLVIVTNETMPALYNYVSSLSKKAQITTPFLFISLKNFSTFSRKILGFRSSIVIGQQLLHDVSDEELEALIAQQIGHIKYYHTNKKAMVNGITLIAYIIPALSSLLVSKQFAKQADMFASKVAGKANGLITFYERLKAKDQLIIAEYNEVSRMLTQNAANIPLLSYLILTIGYYMSKTEHYIEKTYNKWAYPSHQERIDAAKKYLAQQEMRKKRAR